MTMVLCKSITQKRDTGKPAGVKIWQEQDEAHASAGGTCCTSRCMKNLHEKIQSTFPVFPMFVLLTRTGKQRFEMRGYDAALQHVLPGCRDSSRLYMPLNDLLGDREELIELCVPCRT